FGCYINGKLWLPKADWKAYFDPIFQLLKAFVNDSAEYVAGYLTVKSALDPVKQTISFGWPDYAKKLGQFHTNKKGVIDHRAFSVWFSDSNPNKWYSPDHTGLNMNNRLDIIHFDTINRVVSGTFRFVLYREANNGSLIRSDSMVFSDGRFDIRYHQ
ncbi:MAG TPA: hypothetical protein PKD78_03620, partial [Saprospiraceae bacterium]|nr:hypothetical protein [Saprospiraceae bacterium]